MPSFGFQVVADVMGRDPGLFVWFLRQRKSDFSSALAFGVWVKRVEDLGLSSEDLRPLSAQQRRDAVERMANANLLITRRGVLVGSSNPIVELMAGEYHNPIPPNFVIYFEGSTFTALNKVVVLLTQELPRDLRAPLSAEDVPKSPRSFLSHLSIY